MDQFNLLELGGGCCIEVSTVNSEARSAYNAREASAVLHGSEAYNALDRSDRADDLCEVCWYEFQDQQMALGCEFGYRILGKSYLLDIGY